MTAIDKAAIAWTIAIVAIGVAIASLGGQLQAPSASVMEREDSMEKTSETMDKMEKSMEEQKEMIKPNVAPKPEPKVMEQPKVVPEPKVVTGPQTVKASIPKGTSVPGCEEKNACYLPSSVSIKVGDTVKWSNDDTAAHTVTSGSATNGPSGVFDSSLLIAGGTFEHKFTSSGTIDYYCMVHPWMTGKIQVS